MARLLVVAVRDRMLDAYAQPIFVPSQGLAIRSFSDEINRDGSPMNQHPDDYDLYLLGWFDDEAGRFQNEDKPTQICIGKSVFIAKER